MNAESARKKHAIERLKSQFGERLSTSHTVREHHGRDITHPVAQPPDAVIFPADTAEVSGILKICNTARVPVIAFGWACSSAR